MTIEENVFMKLENKLLNPTLLIISTILSINYCRGKEKSQTGKKYVKHIKVISVISIMSEYLL